MEGIRAASVEEYPKISRGGIIVLEDKSGRKILIIDGHSLAHRAYYALPATLTRADGMPTNAVLGFCNMVAKMLEDGDFDAGVCAFDTPAPTFRHEQFEDYKATRKPMDDSLRAQMPIVREAAEAFGFTLVELDGWEADDVIGTIARMVDEAGDEATIVTGDKDALQLVSKNVRVVLTRRGISEFDEYGPDEVRERYGFDPKYVPDFKGLMGDPSDNLPGVPGVGEKTAMRLVSEMGTVENVLENVHSLRGERLRNNLLEYADVALESKRLATIDRNAPIDVDIEQCCSIRQDPERLADFLRKQDFRALMKRLGLRETRAQQEDLGGLFAIPPAEVPGRERQEPWQSVETEIVNTQKAAEELARRLTDAGRFGLDVIGIGPRAMTARVEGLAFEAQDVSAYVPVGSGDGRLPAGAIAEAFGEVLADAEVEKLCHDLKEKIILLKSVGCELRGVTFDSMIASYLIDPGARNAQLCDVAEKWLGVEAPKVREAIESGAKKARDENYCPEPVEMARMCAGCLSLLPELEATLLASVSSNGMEKLYRDVEMPLTRTLADMEIAGVKVDSDRLRELSREMDARLDQLVADIYVLAGQEFNVNSTKQLGYVLFDRLGLPPQKKTKTGYSTDAEVLESLSNSHPIIQKVVDYREVSKLKSTYVDALAQLVNPKTGRIHTSFNQTVTATGRLSSADPNLQNIPIRTEEGRRIRDVFIPGHEGWVIMSADYSQIELRVLAHIAQDPALIQSFLADEDIHRRTAAAVFGVDFDDVTPEMRSRAKAVNFGIVYGISEYGLARNIGVSQAEAKDFIDRYFEKYSGVRNYMDSIVAQAKIDGYVTTLMNRRRYLPELSSPSFQVRKFAERVAMNTPIQGSAADIIKRAMVGVHARLRDGGCQARLLLQVHDELVLEAPREELEEIAGIVNEEMSGAMALSIPLKVDIAWGESWMKAK
ncbi:MAG: DNA polymerase I [Firmicutes bacterium]|nr:DNA polymerase I [Bacillota bacterium]MDD4336408.1 DNA polymerase I [Bacillota bacterium]MDD4792676.1 DNA polymerase I [Bacillota bacterium]